MADERVSLIVEDGTSAGLTLRGFETYRIRNDVRQMGASFDGKLAPIDDPAVLEPLLRHPKVRIEVDGTPTFKGWVVGTDSQADRGGSWSNIQCQDFLGYACRWDLPRGFSVTNLSIEEAFRAALARYMPADTAYLGSNDANRQLVGTRRVRVPDGTPAGVYGETGYNERGEMTYGYVATGPMTYRYSLDPGTGLYVRETKEVTITDRDDREIVPQPGQTVGGFLREVCEHHRLLCWQAGDGSIVITRPRYDQNALVTLARGEVAVEGTIESGGWTRNPGDQPAEMETCGRVGRKGEAKALVAAQDPVLYADGWRGFKLVIDEDLRDLDAATERSRRAMHDAQLPTNEYRCRVSGHGFGTYLLAPDTLMHVRDPKWGTDEDLYCLAREWSKSRENGTETSLILAPPGLLLSE